MVIRTSSKHITASIYSSSISVDENGLRVTPGAKPTDPSFQIIFEPSELSVLKENLDIFYAMQDIETYLDDREDIDNSIFDDRELIEKITRKYLEIKNAALCGETAPQTWRQSVHEAVSAYKTDLQKYTHNI